MVKRMCLNPGEVYFHGLDCSVARPARYHRLDGQRRGNICASAAAAQRACSPETSTDLEMLTLNGLLRSADYRGSDVRLDTGEVYKPASWPRRSIDPAKWSWYPLVAHRFYDAEHINILEVRAAHLSLKWRTRASKIIGSRFFHLLESQVALAVLVKRRSSSWRLNRALTRSNALILAGYLFPTVALL